MPKRVVIHAGFHKTGTSTVQLALRVNRATLRPYLRSILKPPLKSVCYASRGYSTWRDPISLLNFRRRLRAVLQDLAPMPRRTLVLSAEELSGHLPGREGLEDYAAAVALAGVMDEVVTAVFPKVEKILYYSTREPVSWLRSAYWQHVRASAMVLDFDDYKRSYAGSANLEQIVYEIGQAVHARVVHARLDSTGDMPAGPATPLLDLCDVPQEIQSGLSMQPVNAHLGADVLLALLEANRTIPDRDQRNEVKLGIIQQALGQNHD